MPDLQVVSPFQPTGDQPQAIAELVAGLEGGLRAQTAAWRYRHRQDLHCRQGHRPGTTPYPRPGP